jgi:hypothetical protein
MIGFRTGTVLAAAATLILGVGAGTATAQTDSNQQAASAVSTAAADCVVTSVSVDNAAFVCWQHNGDILYNCDNASEGHHPVVFYYRSTSSARCARSATPSARAAALRTTSFGGPPAHDGHKVGSVLCSRCQTCDRVWRSW